MPKVASGARSAAHAVGKLLPCYSPQCAHNDAHSRVLEEGSSNMPGKGWKSIFAACSSKVKTQHIHHVVETPKLKFDRVEISTKMKDIIERLKPICAKVSTILNLELLGSNRTTIKDSPKDRPITSSEIIEPTLYGRDDQKRTVVDGITHGEYVADGLTVLPIVGPGGIGKTTFTQHVYQEVKNHFQVSVWTCVSLNFNANKLLQDIVNKIPEVNGENRTASDEERIVQRLKSKRFLLVLDDMWTYHEGEWKKLLAPFRKGEEKGNIIIVTTRIPEVAKMVKTVDSWIPLERLLGEDFMSFFEACVFGEKESFNDHDTLREVGKQIVDKLKGFPLAAKTVGRLLRNQLNLDHWRRVLDSKEWELQTSDDDIMPALKLSYDYLPFHLQQCFCYCALFPEDYEFDSKELIHLWMGLDILHSRDQNKRIGDVGESYLNELINYGFFKKMENKYGSACYVIHDLLHDLAVKVSSDECLSIYSSNMGSIQIPPSVRHISIIIDNDEVKDRVSFQECKKDLRALDKRLNAESIRTLMLLGEYHGSFAKVFSDLFKESKALRVIYLSGAMYNVENVLCNFSKLVHLRYLGIKKHYHGKVSVSSTTARLYHLRILDVQECHIDSSFPRDMRNLTKMLHFLVSDHSIHSEIVEVGKLKHLQELRRFKVKKENYGFELKELGRLQELHGSLCICNLEKVEAKEEADEAKLIQKYHLKELTLDWDIERSNNNKNPMREEDILESLKPHSNLQKLCIRGHGGAKCPTWLGTNLSVPNLDSLCLDDVGWRNLPPIGELWTVSGHCDYHGQSIKNLKRLELVKIATLKKLVGNGPCHSFSHLETLVIKDCAELTELSFSRSTCDQQEQEVNMSNWFPRLRELKIVNCPKLLSLPPIPWTRAPWPLSIKGVGLCFEKLKYRKNKVECGLTVVGMDAQDGAWRKVLAFDNLAELKDLAICRSPPLPLDHLQVLTSLKTLSIDDPSNGLWPVEGESHAGNQFPVESLSVNQCGASGKEFTRLLSHFPKLSNLDISGCQKIARVGVVGKQVTAMSGRSPSPSARKMEDEHTGGGEEIAAEAEDGVLLLPPQLQNMKINDCPNLILGLPSDSLDEDKEARGGGGLQGLGSLQSLEIWRCPKVLSSYSSSSCFPFPSSLQVLSLSDLEGMEVLSNLVSLTSLSIRKCGGLTSEGLGAPVPLSNLVSLTVLYIDDCGGLISEGLGTLLTQGQLTELIVLRSPMFLVGCSEPSRPPCSSKLRVLYTDDIAGVLAASFCSLISSSLATLRFQGNSEVERFTKEQEEALQLLTSLQNLRFIWCDELQHLPAGLHKLAKLESLQVNDCRALRSLPNDGLPSSLQDLHIRACPAIRSLPKVDRLASSLRVLNVRYGNSEELKRQCCKLKGTIPTVYT